MQSSFVRRFVATAGIAALVAACTGVQATPAPTIATSPVCAGASGSASITNNGGGTYFWSASGATPARGPWTARGSPPRSRSRSGRSS